MFETRRTPLVFAALALAISLSPRPGFGQGFKIIHYCAVTESKPHKLVLNTADGFLYGVTQNGGAHLLGSVIKVDASGNITTLYSFAGPPDGLQPQEGLFFNDADSFLYGTTPNGGTDNGGIVFKIDTSGNNYSSVYQAFASGCNPNGSTPNASLIKANNNELYVPMTNCGNPDEEGVILQFDTTLAETRIGAFVSSIGTNNVVYPMGHLVQGPDDNLYGTSPTGAPASGIYGGVYSIGLDAGSAPVLVHGFTGPDGLFPSAPLLLATDGYLYGTTLNVADSQGQPQNTGTIFRIDTSGNFQTMHAFNGKDGALAQTGLMQASDGYLYGGVTAADNLPYAGVIYRMDLSGNFKVVARPADKSPWDELVQGSDGKLYGTASDTLYGVIYTLDLTQTITDIVPNSGPAAGGTAATIDGTGFVSGATVNIGGGPPLKAVIPDPTHANVTTPADAPGTIEDVWITQPDGTVISLYGGYFYDFADVPAGDIFESYVRKLLANGITAGCGGGDYCRNDPVKRKQMAVFALKAKYGASYSPPPAVGIFTDVPTSDPFAPWIEELYTLGVVGGCGPGPTYCPDNPVLRQQMPVFLLKSQLGTGYTPPACTGMFADVPCPSLFADWIEDVVTRNIAAGCGGGDFCPLNPTTRGQMAPFLVKTFVLP